MMAGDSTVNVGRFHSDGVGIHSDGGVSTVNVGWVHGDGGGFHGDGGGFHSAWCGSKVQQTKSPLCQ